MLLALVSSPAGCIEMNLNNYSKLHLVILTHTLFNFKEEDTYSMQTTHSQVVARKKRLFSVAFGLFAFEKKSKNRFLQANL